MSERARGYAHSTGGGRCRLGVPVAREERGSGGGGGCRRSAGLAARKPRRLIERGGLDRRHGREGNVSGRNARAETGKDGTATVYRWQSIAGVSRLIRKRACGQLTGGGRDDGDGKRWVVQWSVRRIVFGGGTAGSDMKMFCGVWWSEVDRGCRGSPCAFRKGGDASWALKRPAKSESGTVHNRTAKNSIVIVNIASLFAFAWLQLRSV